MNLPEEDCSPPIYGIEADPERTAGAAAMSILPAPDPDRAYPVS